MIRSIFLVFVFMCGAAGVVQLYGQHRSGVEQSSITFVSVPEDYIEISEEEGVPEVFDVKAVTTCNKSGGRVVSLQTGNIIKVGDGAAFLQALKTVADGDEIELTANITIQPGPSFPNTLGVWHPLVIGKSITINGGTNHYQIMTERGLPWGIGGDVVFKNLNLNMVPEVNQRAVIYVSDGSVVFDNVTTKGESNVSTDRDPRPTLVAGTWNDREPVGAGATITIKNASGETIFADIFTGNHNTDKTTPTRIEIESEDVRVKGGIFARGLTDGSVMKGASTIVTSSRRISRYEGSQNGGETYLEFVNADVIPEVTVADITKISLQGTSKVKILGVKDNVSNIAVSRESLLTLGANDAGRFDVEELEGSGMIYIPNGSHLYIDNVVNQPVVAIREWLFKPEAILGLVHCDNEQPGEILYFVNEKLYMRKDGKLVEYGGTVPPDVELFDAFVEYEGETREEYDDEYFIFRSWRAYDNCGGEEIFEQMIVVTRKVSTGVDSNSFHRVSVFPNPTTGIFAFSGGEPTGDVKVFDISGRMVLRMAAASKYDIGMLKRGVYFIVAEVGGKPFRAKVTRY